uniref:(northern house mosquito) hypothetical protein n=2 Tax=Culex pipiens TaxID=7175 RepID=A0A8D8L2A2_CULPI
MVKLICPFARNNFTENGAHRDVRSASIGGQPIPGGTRSEHHHSGAWRGHRMGFTRSALPAVQRGPPDHGTGDHRAGLLDWVDPVHRGTDWSDRVWGVGRSVREAAWPAAYCNSTAGLPAVRPAGHQRLPHLPGSRPGGNRWRRNPAGHPDVHRGHCRLSAAWNVGLTAGDIAQSGHPGGIHPGQLSPLRDRSVGHVGRSGPISGRDQLPAGDAVLFAATESKRKSRTILDVLPRHSGTLPEDELLQSRV